jgi:hypothetical protein
MNVQVNQALYWWQRLSPFGHNRVRVKFAESCMYIFSIITHFYIPLENEKDKKNNK